MGRNFVGGIPMLIEEVLASVDAIPDPYIKSATYAKIGERLAKVKNSHYKTAFLRAIETAKEIDDPVNMFRALLSVGYSMGKAGLKSSKRIYLGVLEDSRMLPAPQRDVLMQSAASYMLALGEINEAITYALEIKNPKLRNETLLRILEANTEGIGKDHLKVAYRLRKSKLIFEHINEEPHRSMAIMSLMKAYLHLESYENAISLIGEMSRKEWIKLAFKEVAFYLKDKGVLEHYVDSLESIARELTGRFGEEFTVELSFVFALSGQSSVAVQLLRTLKDHVSAMVDMAMELLERDNDVLPGFIYSLNEEEATAVGKAVMNKILEHPELAEERIIKAVGESTPSEEVWAKIARYYIKVGNIEAAMKIGSLLKDVRLKSIVMTDVAHNLLKAGDVERAIDAALEVRNPEFSSILISEILLKALEMELRGRVKSWNGSKR